MLELRLQDLLSLCSSLDLISPGYGRKQNAARMSAEEKLALYLDNVQRFTTEMLNKLQLFLLEWSFGTCDLNKNRHLLAPVFYYFQLKIFVKKLC